MTANWTSALTGLLALGLVVALSPLTFIPAVLVMHTQRPRPTSLAFLVGWLVGLIALTAIFVELSALLGGLGKTPPTWSSWLRVGVGAALIGFGVLRWLRRHRHSKPPRWMSPFSRLTPLRAGVTGVVLAVVRPEVLFICAAAGLAIGTAGLGVGGAWVAVAFYVTVTASSVAIPVLAYAVAGERLDPFLARLKDWMEKHNATLEAAVLIMIGLMVLYKGIHSL